MSALAVWIGRLPDRAVDGRARSGRRPSPPSSSSTPHARPRPPSSSGSWRRPWPCRASRPSSPRCSQIHGRFAGPAAVGVAFNLGIIVGVVVGHGRSASRPRRGGSWSAPRSRCCCSCPSSRACCASRARRPALTHPRLGAVGLLALPGGGRVGPPADQQLHRQALRLEPRGRPGVGAELRQRAGPGAPGGAAAAPADAAVPADRAADLGGPRDRGAGAFRACRRAARAGLHPDDGVPGHLLQETAQLAFGRGASATRVLRR